MIIVELMGVPGCGKTKYLENLNDIGEYKDLKVYSKQQLKSLFVERIFKPLIFLKFIVSTKLYYKISARIYHLYNFDKKLQNEFIKNFSKLYEFVLSINSARQINIEHKKKIIHWFLRGGEYYQLSKILDIKGIFINDEGLFQRASSLFISEKEKINHSLLMNYIYNLPEINEIIYIKRDLDKCLNTRISERGVRLSDLNEKEIKEIIDQNHELFEFISQYILSNHSGKYPLKVIENTN